MKCLTTQEANAYLSRIGMEIGNWNQITEIGSSKQSTLNWTNYRAPERALELFNFSQYVAGWLPRGEWKIFQIDNSTYLDTVQAALVGRLLFGSEEARSLVDNRTFLFELGNNEDTDNNTELLITNLIYAFLLFQCHGYVVSSNRSAGQYLAIQDGFVYFYSKSKDISGADTLLKDFENNPLRSPPWIRDIVAEGQERGIAKG
jgi:hypothetical protein